jgi:CO/xanthine dehydrogenase Mo-binding subunit
MSKSKPDRSIGKSSLRLDALGKVTGATPYPSDIDLDDQLWMKVVFSERVHARIRHIDTSQALAYPGVLAVLTAADIPCNEYGLIMNDQPVLCGPGSSKPGAEFVRCLMDNVAAVVAETEEIAAAAAALVRVDYEDLAPVTDAYAAMAEGAPQLHAEKPHNILSHYRLRRGDMAAAWAAAEVVVEGFYQTGYQEHAYLQPEAGLGYIDDEGRLTVLVAGQWTHEDQMQIAHALKLPQEQVRVIYPAVGGAFGGREDMSIQILLALAVQKVGRPVKIIWSRAESILGHHKRHPIYMKLKWGATRQGKLVAAWGEVVGDAGAYAYTSTKVMGNANLMICGPYEIPNIEVDTYAVLTNNIPTGAFRGFGGPQAAFAAEGMMNRLAEALEIDPIRLRLMNCLREGSPSAVGTPMPAGITIDKVVAECGRQSDYWEASPQGNWHKIALPAPSAAHKRRGVGFACAFKNIGFSFGFPEQCWATVEIHGNGEIEKVIVKHAGADVGQGAHTVIMQMTAEAVGVPMEKVELIASDTAFTNNAGSASASRLTFMAGNSILGAAREAVQKWQDEERPAIATYQYRPPKTTPYEAQTGFSKPNFAYGYVAQAVEVEVDIETGQVDLIRVVCANDVGKAINPQQVVGQLEGAVIQAQGYAIMENLVSKDGRILNPYLSTYLIPTVYDIPKEVKSVILEYPDPLGPWGARGMAEMPFMPLAPAICAALHDATGVWIDQIPLTPDRVVKALRAHGVAVS